MTSLTPLCELGFLYGTDKSPKVCNEYTPFYYELLKDKRNEIKKVLEIGIGGLAYRTRLRKYNSSVHIGASLKMWRDFFPNAQIYGADIDPKTMFSDDRIETIVCDSTKLEDVEKLVKQTGVDIDLVIDDGSHKDVDQVATCKNLMSVLKKDIIYIIEDVKHPAIINQLSAYDCYIPELYARRETTRLIIVKNK